MSRSHSDDQAGAVILAGVVLCVGAVTWVANTLGTDFMVTAECLIRSVALGLALLLGGALLSPSWVPGPIRLAMLAAVLWAAWIPAMINRALKVARIDPAVGPMPYDYPLPVYGHWWFQWGGVALFAAFALWKLRQDWRRR